MKIATIICEYNPFHNGHLFHINETKKLTMCDKLICIMSGNFVQRGEPSCLDKFTRAKHAISNGADLVIELPQQFVLSSANLFALGGIKILETINQSHSLVLSFGAENNNIEDLSICSSFIKDTNIQQKVKQLIQTGISYPKAYSHAVETIYPTFSTYFTKPNNTLAIEYLSAIASSNREISPLAIKRDDNYNMETLDKGVSASAIRNQLNLGIIPPSKYLPQCVIQDLSSRIYSWEEKIFSILKYYISENIIGTSCLEEGLDRKAISIISKASSYTELINDLKSKRYTMSRIKRGLLNALIGNKLTFEEIKYSSIKYINALAVEENSRDLLGIFNIPVITKPSEKQKLNVFDALSDNADRLYTSLLNFENYMRIVKR